LPFCNFWIFAPNEMIVVWIWNGFCRKSSKIVLLSGHDPRPKKMQVRMHGANSLFFHSLPVGVLHPHPKWLVVRRPRHARRAPASRRETPRRRRHAQDSTWGDCGGTVLLAQRGELGANVSAAIKVWQPARGAARGLYHRTEPGEDGGDAGAFARGVVQRRLVLLSPGFITAVCQLDLRGVGFRPARRSSPRTAYWPAARTDCSFKAAARTIPDVEHPQQETRVFAKTTR
jgi:hypothetical protein